jgi:AcrR family transcriptional regulator
MPYRQTENVTRKLASRRRAILTAAQDAAAEGGMAAVQMAAIAERAGVAAGTVYRYFPSKTELVAALTAELAEREMAALRAAVHAAPGPLSALAAAIATFALRALAQRRVIFAVTGEPVEPEIDAARTSFRHSLTAELTRLIRAALDGGHLPDQDVALAAPTLVGALIEGLVGPQAPVMGDDPAQMRAQVQVLTLFGLRALGVIDARARGLVVQTALPTEFRTE